MGYDVDPAVAWAVLACWLLFALTWLGGWVYNLLRAPKVRRRRFSPSILLGAAAAWFVSWLVPTRVWDAIALDNWVVQDFGIVLVFAGTAFALWARVALGTMWSGIPMEREGHELRTSGPFAITRHPIYTGVLAMLLGTAMVYGFGSWTGPLVAGLAGLSFKMRVEESLMRATFGAQYDDYRRRVPALLPRLWA